ncbi:hypothetical protein J4573_09445 [Actinomadura barringtoniae]|uniref:Uncharacterized protein n=1 Tax=Actinomadura barringtoniae TaxID=1427535 RepID=A0A939T2Y5_9ACTN|nr:hypothetical protein [Actinomadura barringtoniae]MBO2447308.1 hypothetical protein [Actinomadura barringtoniae]
MFWRKQRAAIDGFHSLHQALIWQQGFSASMLPDEWGRLVHSLAGHGAAVRRRKWAPPQRATTVVVPLVQVLAADTRGDGTLSVAADLRGPNAQGKLSAQQTFPGQRRGVRKIVEWWSYDPWLSMRAELRDGSELELAVADRTRFRKIHKRSQSGKYKTKMKTKTVHRITVTRRLPAGTALQRPASPPPGWISVRVRDGKRPVIRASAKVEAGRQHERMLPEQILHMATELFRWSPADSAGAAGAARRTS